MVEQTVHPIPVVLANQAFITKDTNVLKKQGIRKGDRVCIYLPMLPLVSRMKAAIPPRERSKVLAILLEKEISAREKNLYLCAKELEESKGLRDEMVAWDSEFGGDGDKDS